MTDETNNEAIETDSEAFESIAEESEGISEILSTYSEAPAQDYTEILESINDSLASIQGLQENIFSTFHTLYWVALGLFVGVSGTYILIREALKKWER